MKFSAKQEIEAPISTVWQYLSDFKRLETLAQQRKMRLERLDKMRKSGAGAKWNAHFVMRGKARLLHIQIVEFTPEEAIDCDIDSTNIGGGVRFELTQLSQNRTRLHFFADIRPKTMTARILIQSLRFTKGRTQRKLDASMAKLAAYMTAQSA